MSATEPRELKPLGTVIATHGLRGELKVRTHPEDRDALLATERIFLRDAAGRLEAHRLDEARRNKGYVVIRLDGLEQIDRVEGLVGQELLIAPGDVRREADRLFWFDVAGIRVVDRQRGEIGTLEDMFVTAAHGVYVVEGSHGEVLIPAVPPFVLDLDREAGVLRVDVPDGLFPGHS